MRSFIKDRTTAITDRIAYLLLDPSRWPVAAEGEFRQPRSFGEFIDAVFYIGQGLCDRPEKYVLIAAEHYVKGTSAKEEKMEELKDEESSLSDDQAEVPCVSCV